MDSEDLPTYHPPTEDEISYHRGLLKGTHSEARSISEEIERQTTLLASLRERQRAFTDLVSKHSAFLAPIRRLPPEVLQAIFIWCLPTDHNPSFSPKEAPFLLSHICRRWRDVAFRTPRLWTRIHVHIPIYPEALTSYHGLGSACDTGRLLESARLTQEEVDLYRCIEQRWEEKMHEYRAAIEAWLTRAAKCPLTISVQQSQNVSDSTKGKEEQGSILETVFQVSKQWKSIQINAPTSTLERLLTMSRDDLECLEHFAAQWDISYRALPAAAAAGGGAGGTAGEGSGHSKPGITLFSSAPNLKRLSLQNIPHTIAQLHVQWHNITELILGEFAIPRGAPRHLLFAHRALDVLEKCPNLVRCRLTLGNPHAFSISPTGGGHQFTQIDESREVVRLEYLECLCVLEGDPLGNFFEFLEVPKLKELVFKTTQYPRPSLAATQVHNNTNPMTAASCLLSLLERYGENIEKLRMDESIMSIEDLQRCFGLLKNLTHLKLTRRSCFRRVWHSRTSRRVGQTDLNFVGSLTRSIWERMTPKVPVTTPPGFVDSEVGSEGGGGTERMVSCHRDSELLLPKLTSFSCRVHAPELVQDHILQFLQARRHPSRATTLLKNFAIMFYSTEPEQRYKNIPGELEKLGVNTEGMGLEVKYRRTYGDSLLGPNDFIVAPSLRPTWPTTGDRPSMFFGVGDIYEEDE